jgi:hypothetical protein
MNCYFCGIRGQSFVSGASGALCMPGSGPHIGELRSIDAATSLLVTGLWPLWRARDLHRLMLEEASHRRNLVNTVALWMANAGTQCPLVGRELGAVVPRRTRPP